MKIFKAGAVIVLVFLIIKACNVFEKAGEMDGNGNVFAFAFIVSFFVLLIFLLLFSGIKTKKDEDPKPMATPARRYPGYRKCRSKYR